MAEIMQTNPRSWRWHWHSTPYTTCDVPDVELLLKEQLSHTELIQKLLLYNKVTLEAQRKLQKYSKFVIREYTERKKAQDLEQNSIRLSNYELYHATGVKVANYVTFSILLPMLMKIGCKKTFFGMSAYNLFTRDNESNYVRFDNPDVTVTHDIDIALESVEDFVYIENVFHELVTIAESSVNLFTVDSIVCKIGSIILHRRPEQLHYTIDITIRRIDIDHDIEYKIYEETVLDAVIVAGDKYSKLGVKLDTMTSVQHPVNFLLGMVEKLYNIVRNPNIMQDKYIMAYDKLKARFKSMRVQLSGVDLDLDLDSMCDLFCFNCDPVSVQLLDALVRNESIDEFLGLKYEEIQQKLLVNRMSKKE
jgi:hypothetical protein